MLELLTTDEFAKWFSALEEETAEDVAETLEVIAQLGTGTDPPASTDWLLWYEHPSAAEKFAVAPHASPEVRRFMQDWGVFLGYVKRVVRHLESPQFVARLGRLDPRAAATVTGAVTRIRRAATVRALGVSDFYVKKRIAVRALSPADAKTLDGFADVAEVRQAYFVALAAAGFEVADPPSQSAALREITLRSRAPGLRLLYGIDAARRRGLVVLGEWLDRSFYGDSVRRAEELWRRFAGGDAAETQPTRER